MRTWTLSAFIALLVLAGCKGAEAPKLTRAAPWAEQAGWRNHEAKGFSIAAPNDWGYRPSAAVDMNSMLNGGTTRTDLPDEPIPQLQQMEEKKHIYLTLYNRAVKGVVGEPMTRFYVKRTPSEAASVTDAAKNEKDDIGRASPMAAVDLPVGPAAQFKWTKDMITGDKVYDIEYLLVDGPDTYRIVFESANDNTSIESVAPDVMKTFRVK